MTKTRDMVRVFAFIILILFSIVGLLFASLSVYEYIRLEKGESPASISYNFQNSSFMLIEHDISKENTVENMPAVSFFDKIMAVISKIAIYLLPFSLGGFFVYAVFYHGRDKERREINRIPRPKFEYKNGRLR